MRSAFCDIFALAGMLQPLFFALTHSCLIGRVPRQESRDNSPEIRALSYLAREVPRWSAENKCFSCHNNGDAARALYNAKRLAYPVSTESLGDTTAWLAAPDRWDHNGGDGPFSDKRLARIQFAAALRSAVEAGVLADRNALIEAAQRVADDQDADGAWPSDAAQTVGSPATYGRPLATFMARETLGAADTERFAANIERADTWLRGMQIHSMIDAAAVLLASSDSQPVWRDQRDRALALIRKGQSEGGGWGPFATAAPEPFDTALVLLALLRSSNGPHVRTVVQRGREFLIANQLQDGSWTETTRPAGAESYAQRLSTTAWATLALIETRENVKRH
jgi:hypothetical protein